MIPSIQQYYALQPAQFGYLEQITLSREIQEMHCSDYTLELVMRSLSSKQNNRRLRVTFVGVRNVQIGKLDGLMAFALDIQSLHGCYLEELHFEVVESEYHAISFLCANFTAKIENNV